MQVVSVRMTLIDEMGCCGRRIEESLRARNFCQQPDVVPPFPKGVAFG